MVDDAYTAHPYYCSKLDQLIRPCLLLYILPYHGHLLNKHLLDATIAQWNRLRLPSCRPWFETKAHHLHFDHL